MKEVNSLKLSRGSVHKDIDRRRSPDRGGRALDVALAGLIAERLATETAHAVALTRSPAHFIETDPRAERPKSAKDQHHADEHD